ncbi:hypothetical protein D3C86_1468760 [compost metagenome]
MKNFKMLSKIEMRKVTGGNFVVCPEGLCFNPIIQACDWPSSDCTDGSPGGDNGNPCPTLCEPMGGYIACAGTINGVPTFHDSNCNQHPYNPNMHNVCINSATGDFWC